MNLYFDLLTLTGAITTACIAIIVLVLVSSNVFSRETSQDNHKRRRM